MKLNLNVPTFIEVGDYHELPFVQDHLKKLNPSLRVKEVGFNGEYVGLIYLGRAPSKDKIKELAKKKRIVLSLDW
jgi:hypothetical protein